MDQYFPIHEIKEFCLALLIASDVSEKDAEIVTEVLVDTCLEGIDTHGISRLPIYLSRLGTNRINSRPKITIKKTGAVAQVNGDNGLGQLVAVHSMSTAIELANEYGIGFVTAKHSNHSGASSYYCKMAARQQMMGLMFTNAPQAVPPWGGKEPYFGTNPIAFGFPNNDEPVIVDMSSSVVARGNIIVAAKEGRSIPSGWAIDKDGLPTTDPNKALEGAVLPVGGAKGYALGLAVEIMSGILSGSAYGKDVGFIYDEKIEPVDIGHSFIAININSLMPFEFYEDRMSDMIEKIKKVPLADGFETINIPGERRQRTAEKRQKNGIPISENLLKELNNIAIKLGINLLSH